MSDLDIFLEFGLEEPPESREYERLRALSKHLCGTPDPVGGFRPRLAASICARSEAELFVLSAPRFAIRAYIGGHGFVNARRLAEFANSYERSFGTNTKLGSEIPKAGCIGDSLLLAPKRLRADYMILETELGLAYGESDRIVGTPFVTHTPAISGGMCAQAVCFQATALRQFDARGIFGVAEITALAEDENAAWFDIGGMTAEKIVKYFSHERVGLAATYVIVDRFQGISQVEQEEMFAKGMQAYVASGMPVILPVDLREMERINLFDSIPVSLRPKCKRSSSSTESKPDETDKPLEHAVVLVGVQKKDNLGQFNAGNLKFLLNDPATFPFIEATGRDLSNCRGWRRKSSESSGNLGFIPVTPSNVRLPLLTQPSLEFYEFGLANLARFLRRFDMNSRPILNDYPGELTQSEQFGEFRLVNLATWPFVAEKSVECHTPPDDCLGFAESSGVPELIDMIREQIQNKRLTKRWAWLQVLRETTAHGSSAPETVAWIWNAENPPLQVPNDPRELKATEFGPESLRNRYLLAGYSRIDGQWKCTENREFPFSVEPSPPAQLRGSLVTSFDPKTGALPFLLNGDWPTTRVPRCDLYVWMKPDLNTLAQEARSSGITFNYSADWTAAEAMSEWSNNDDFIDWTAGLLVRQERATARCHLAAIASFVPEISARFGSEHAKAAARSLQYLARLGIAIRKHQESTDVPKHEQLSAIEIVCGSRVEAVLEASSKNRGVSAYLAANRAGFDSIQSIVSNMRAALNPRLCSDLRELDLFFAMELEPGPLFAASTLPHLVALANALRLSPDLGSVVGFNADFAHYRLAGITPQLLFRHKQVMQKVVHAHISGEHRHAHICDAPTLAEDLLPWVDVLKWISASSDLRGRGLTVAQELEAAASPDLAFQAAEDLRRLLGEIP